MSCLTQFHHAVISDVLHRRIEGNSIDPGAAVMKAPFRPEVTAPASGCSLRVRSEARSGTMEAWSMTEALPWRFHAVDRWDDLHAFRISW
jgi:hypothetical protein